ncbi:MAG: CHAT domain-containing protein [Bacteroidales bacterium]|nr:CHAT domain-containing protein [Bacteroidales bacterium]
MKWCGVLILMLFYCVSAIAQSDFQKHFASGQNAAQRGLYAKAVNYYLKAEKNTKRNYEKSRVYQAIADSYTKLSDYTHAINYYTKLLSIYNGDNRKKIILNLSDLWFLTGQYQKIIDNLQPMQNAPDETIRLNNLALAYLRLDRYDDAMALIDSVLLNKQSSNYKIALQNKGYLLWNRNKFKEADSLLQMAVAMFDADDPNRYICHANLAKIQAETGNYSSAEDNIETAIRWQKLHLGEKHLDYIISLRKKAEILRAAGKVGDATRSFKDFFYKEREYVAQNFAYMTENERLNFWHSQKPLIDECFALEDDADFLFDVAVFSKSVLEQTNINFGDAVDKDETLKQLYEQIIEARTAVRSASVPDRKQYESKVEKLEKLFAEKFADYKKFTSTLQLGGKDVKSTLKNDMESVVELIYYNNDSVMKYAALIMQRSKPARFVPLFTQDEIENFQLKDSNSVIHAIQSGSLKCVLNLYTDTLLSAKIWDKITPYLPENSTVYFVPDGIFYNFGIEYLCFGRQDLNLFRLSASRVLCRRNRRTVGKGNALIIGGLDYNDASSSVVHDAYTDRTGSVILDKLFGDLYWSSLANTKTETDSVAQIFKRNGIQVSTATLGMGTEDFVKGALSHHNTVLIATHGYSYGFQKIKNEYNMTDSFTQDSTMTLSGIILSGANQHFKQDSTTAYKEDGYITALEISSLDLSNVDLIMLSACQTGLGQVSMDGASGLPRGLKKAGANSIIVSLWEVNDLATRLFSTFFFDYLCKGMSKYEALRCAQRDVRNFDGVVKLKVSTFSQSRMAMVTTEKDVHVKDLKNPYFWAPFILIDGIN